MGIFTQTIDHKGETEPGTTVANLGLIMDVAAKMISNPGTVL